MHLLVIKIRPGASFCFAKVPVNTFFVATFWLMKDGIQKGRNHFLVFNVKINAVRKIVYQFEKSKSHLGHVFNIGGT